MIAELGVVDRKMIAQKMHYLITVVSCLSTTCLFTMLACLESCTDEPSPISSSHNQRSVFLDTAFVDPSEVWLRLSSTDLSGASSFEVYRDTTLILSRHIVQPDTTLIDTMLLPAKIYQYRAYRSVNNRRVESTRALLVQTMDTTSHEFTWDFDTLGDGNGSYLKDVFILNDTSVFAVGALYVRDSAGQYNSDPYNVARWDGRSWKLSTATYVPFNAVFGFADTDVWAGTSAPYHWDGRSWKAFNVTGIFNGYVNKIWGTSSSNMYMVGTNGAIMHFNGSVWQKMESGTDVDLLDIWGTPDGNVVWACGWIDFKPTVLLRLINGVWEKAFEDPYPFVLREDSLSGILTSVWAPNGHRLFILSDLGLFTATSNIQGQAKRIPFPSTWSGFPWILRGNAVNDLVVVGEYYTLAHFNGLTLKQYEQFKGYGRLVSVCVRNNLVVAVGYSFDPINSQGIVVRGRR